MAVTITAPDFATAAGLDTAMATRLLPVATRLVEDYASAAHTELQNEAVIMFGGYLARSAGGAITSKTVGPVTQTFQSNDAAAFRNCGAAALLTRYRVRRAGAIG